jgi:predicted phage terminase large subunit-like protein
MGAVFGRLLQHKARKTRILKVHNTQNKMTRIIMQSSTIINSFVFVKHDSNEYHQFMTNVLSFSKEGKNKNDDAPDCLAGLSMLLKSLFKRLEL